MPKSYIFLLFFFLYSLALLYYGKSGYREIETIDDFFSGGGQMGLGPCIATFVATWFSAASMQGLSGAIYTYGFTFVFYSVLPWFLGAFFLYLLIPGLRASATMTIPEYLGKRYDSKTLQLVSGVVVVVNFILYIVIQVRGFGLVIAEFLEISYPLAIVIVYLFVLYTTFGGMFSIAKSDGFNSFIIFSGVMMAVCFVLFRIGGIGQVFTHVGQIEGQAISGLDYYTKKGSLLKPLAGGHMSMLGLVSAFFGWGLGLAANPQYTVRIVAAKNNRTAQKMIAGSIGFLSIIYIGLIVIGLGARVIHPSLAHVDTVDALLAYIFNIHFPAYLSGVILIAIMAAAISTANSQLLVVSSSFVYDIYQLLSKKNHDDDQLLGLSRLIVFLSGSISLFLALSPPPSLIIYGGYVWGVFSTVFFLPLYGGVFWKKATKNAAVYSMMGGILTLFIFMGTRWHSVSSFGMNPALPSVIVAAGVFFGVSIYEGVSNET